MYRLLRKETKREKQCEQAIGTLHGKLGARPHTLERVNSSNGGKDGGACVASRPQCDIPHGLGRGSGNSDPMREGRRSGAAPEAADAVAGGDGDEVVHARGQSLHVDGALV